MKSAKSTSSAPAYMQLLGAFDAAQSAYKQAKAEEIAAKHQVKDADKKDASKAEEEVLKLQLNYAKHIRKALKARVKIAQVAIKHWLKANTTETPSEEVVTEAKKRGRKAKPKTEVVAVAKATKGDKKPKVKKEAKAVKAVEAPTEVVVVEGAEAPAPKKRGRQPKPKVEVAVVEAAEPKKRGRKAQPKAEVVVVEGAEAPEPKKRGRKPLPKVEVEAVEPTEPKKRGRKPLPKVEVEAVEATEPKKRGRKPLPKVEIEAIEGAEAPEPKKRGRQPKPKVEVEEVVATEPKRRGRPARILPIAEEEEGVAGASARAMLAVEEKAAKPAKAPKAEKAPKPVKEAKAPKAEKAPKPVKEAKAPKAEKVAKPAKEPKTPKAEKAPADGKRGRRPSDELIAQKAAEEAAVKAGLKGADFRIIEGIGPKVTAVLHANGIVAFRDLAGKSYDELKALMTANRQFLVNPTNWARQAQLAADGKMDELEALKAQLFKGK
jgi:predicted flap endonuclease-1-like 5' DNA nuclease